MGLVLISELSKLSLATAIMALTPVSCYYMGSFNYGGKKARDVSNIIPDSIFYMGWNSLSFFCFFLKGDNHCFPQHKRDGFSFLIIITPVGLWRH